MATVRRPKLRGEGDYEGDFALFVLDNPTLHSAFHQFVFLFSGGDWTLVPRSRLRSAVPACRDGHGDGAEKALHDLERHVVSNAMILFTAQAAVHAAARKGIHFPLPRTGHFDTDFWWNLDASLQMDPVKRPRPALVAAADEGRRVRPRSRELHPGDQPPRDPVRRRRNRLRQRWRRASLGAPGCHSAALGYPAQASHP